MGYELHVVYTHGWLESSRRPVVRAEVAAIVEADPELQWSTTDSVGGRYDFIEWKGESIFYWEKDQIVGKNLLEPQIIKLCEIAERLGANVIGDDGEKYEIRRGFLGRKKLVDNSR